MIVSPSDVISRGIFLAPEDRKCQGLVFSRSIKENISYSNIKMFSRYGLYNRKLESSYTENLKNKINIKAISVEVISGDLSGGNQQKVVLAKALKANPKILIIDEPTQGIDVGAKVEIYAILNDLSKQGMSIIVISSELEEIVGLCNRVVVVRNGCISGEVDNVTTENCKDILDLMYKDKVL